MQTPDAVPGFTFKPVLNRNAVSIILWNLFPVIGVLFLGWQPISIFVCYALETIVAGIFNIFKMLAVYRYGQPIPGKSGVVLILFFTFHFFFFVFIQLTLFFSVSGFKYTGMGNVIPNLNIIVRESNYQYALGVFILSNLYQFINDFSFSKTFEKRSVVEQMFEPYLRIFVQQFVVIFGSFIFKATGNDYPVLVVFVLAKIFFDLLFNSLSITKNANVTQSSPY
jgi:hypothetical protein